MNDRKGIDATDYVVGYGRPPKTTQFAAGKSGNPKGRPKGSRTVGAILQDILSQKIAVTENGKTSRVPTLEVMFRRLVNDAKRHWVRHYGDELPSPAEQLMRVQSWDTASKGGPDNDWSVCTTGS
jgi:hypothetical protein